MLTKSSMGMIKDLPFKLLEQLLPNFGYNLKGTFGKEEFILESYDDLGIDEDGQLWQYNGSLPFEVTEVIVPSEPDYEKVTLNTASSVYNSGGGSVQDFIDTFALKIFQSPTDGGLTEIQTRTVDAGELYEVRKTSDDSLATIYSDAAGTTEIAQNGTDNKSGNDGVIEFYIADGEYYVEVDSVRSRFNVKNSRSENNASSFIDKMLKGQAGTIKCYGDSLTYGFDVVTGTAPPINGSGDARAAVTYPEALSDALSTYYGLSPNILNRGYPGDTSESWRSRWQTYDPSDVTIIMYGTNDALPDGSDPIVSIERFKTNIRDLVNREVSCGTESIILLTPPQLLNKSTVNSTVEFRSKHIEMFSNAIAELANELNIPHYSVEDIVGHLGAYAYSDNTHYNQYGYNEWGWNLAAALLPNGVNNTFSIGDEITPLNSKSRGEVTISSESKYVINGDRVAFSLVSGSRPNISLAGLFNDNCFIAATSINSPATSTQTLSVEVSGGDRSGLASSTALISNDGSEVSKRKVVGVKVARGLRYVLLKPVTTVAAVEKIELIKSFIDRSDNLTSKSFTPTYFSPAAAGNNYLSTGAKMQLGGFVDLTVDMSETGCGILLSKLPDTNGFPTNYIWINRLNDTSLYIRKFTGGSPSDTTIAEVFTTGVARYSVSLYYNPSNHSIYVYIDGVLVTTITDADTCIGESATLGLFSTAPANTIEIKSLMSN